MSESEELFRRPREATIRFSDVFGNIPLADSLQNIPDFDAVLTDAVRNTGRFPDSTFPIGAWPELGDYALVLLDQLRNAQAEQSQSLQASGHPDAEALRTSLGGAVLAVINCAPRTDSHRRTGENGDTFYVGLTKAGNEIYGQLKFFRGIHARGWLKELFKIPNEGGLWQEREQFRSSYVTQARLRPNILEQAEPNQVPDIELDGRLAYVDKFGNAKIEVKDIKEAQAGLEPGKKAELRIGEGAGIVAVRAVRSLSEIPEEEIGLYINPTEDSPQSGPGYLELARRVGDPNHTSKHAYAELSRKVSPEGIVRPDEWSRINIELAA